MRLPRSNKTIQGWVRCSGRRPLLFQRFLRALPIRLRFAPSVSVFDKRFHFRLLNDRRSLLSCGVFLCLVAIGENPAGSFAVAIRNRQTEILFLEFAPHVAPSPVDSRRNPCFAERAL